MLSTDTKGFSMGAITINHSYHTERKDLLDVACGYANSKPHSFLKAIYVLGIDLPKEVGLIPEEHQETASKVRHYLCLGKLLEAPWKLFKGVNDLRYRTIELWKEGVWNKGYRWIRDANNLVGPSSDLTEFLFKSNIAAVPKSTFATIKGVNGGSMIFGFGALIIDSLSDLLYHNDVDKTTGENYEKEREKAIVTLLKLAYEVSLFALGLLTFLSTFFGVVVAPTTYLIFSVSSVIAHISRYFYENIGTRVNK
jgi:hypothetical protein